LDRLAKDEKILRTFIHVYCKKEHGAKSLCEECSDVLDYSLKRLQKCPLSPKPMCKDCTVHCYKPYYRNKIKTIMKKVGITLILRGRLDLVWHYFF
jgi:hypothetical protein